MIIPYETLLDKFESILKSRGFTAEKAHIAAEVFAQNSLDGVYSHGVNRFPLVIAYLDKGGIDPAATPEKIAAFGCMERWDGHLGLGILNARLMMDRACDIAQTQGMGLVAIGRTNHWMRGGTYGWQAADRGFIGICWTNTSPNLSPWGGKTPKIGNNPFIIAVPKSDGAHVIIDCALSQFAFGKIEEAKLAGRQLPVPGGYDTAGNMTTDPVEIEKTGRALPIGYWKGSGLSVVLDLVGALLSGGDTVGDIGRKYDMEIGLTQVMIAIDPSRFIGKEKADALIERVIADMKSSEPVKAGGKIAYPGESSLKTRRENLKNGIPVVDSVWEKIKNL